MNRPLVFALVFVLAEWAVMLAAMANRMDEFDAMFAMAVLASAGAFCFGYWRGAKP